MRNIDSNTFPRRFDCCRFLFHRTFAATFATISAHLRHSGMSAPCRLLGVKQTWRRDGPMSPSLIGRLGSSAFRPSTAAVLMSLAGSRFSSESALRPFHHGVRRRGGTIYWAALPSDEQQVQADIRTHLIHRPARDIIPPRGGVRVFSYPI